MAVFAVALCTLLETVNALPLPYGLSRDDIIRSLFDEGFQYELILCFLVAVYGIFISLRTLKRSLKRQQLRRRGGYSDLQHVGRCIMVSICQHHS